MRLSNFTIFNLMLNKLSEQTKTAKRSLFVSDPSRSDRDQSARMLLNIDEEFVYYRMDIIWEIC